MSKPAVLCLVLLATIFATAAPAQTAWSVSPGPVLTPGPHGAWDDGDIQMGGVVQVGDHFLMVYSARRADAPGHGANCLGMAMSPDGVNWFRYAGNPVLGPDCRGPCLLHDPADAAAPYKLWYGHWQEDGGATEIRCATSTDGVHWTHAGTAIARGAPGAYDEQQVAHPCAVKAGDTYYLYYDAYAKPGPVPGPNRAFAVATSTDAVHWTKAGIALDSAGGDAWDYRIGDPEVIFRDGRFLMWYKGAAPSGSGPIRERLGFAASADGLTFARRPGNPVLSPSADAEAFPSCKMFGPSVLWDGAAFRMWFGGPNGGTGATGFAHAVSK